MKAVILCGGQGTRLREETEFKPKPLVQIGGLPILWHIMKFYSAYGIREFVLCLGYKGEMIKQYFANDLLQGDLTLSLRSGKKIFHDALNRVDDWEITFAETGPDAMTGSRIKKIEKYVGNEDFCLTYGDGLSNIDLHALLVHHKKKGRIGTLTGVNPQSRFGLVKTTPDDVVSAFVEKPVLYDEYVNGGFYVFKTSVFDYVSSDDGCVFEKEPLSSLASGGQLSIYRHNGFWYCMDTYRDYLDLNRIWNSGSVPWRVWK